MRLSGANHYELAFENWLRDRGVQCSEIDESKRAVFEGSKIKSFDFFVYSSTRKILVAEVKGKKFKGKSFENLTGLECWVNKSDIEGLCKWQKILGQEYEGVFVFAYMAENVDVDFDGRDVYRYNGNKYLFFGIGLEDYLRYMKVRSPKWQTLTLPADKFRASAREMKYWV